MNDLLERISIHFAQFARLGPKINNLISGPKNLGWRCHVNSLVAKKEFPFFLSLILVESAMMRYMVLIMLKICELMTLKFCIVFAMYGDYQL